MNAQTQPAVARDQRYARVFAMIGRALLTFAFICLGGAWLSQLTGGSLPGMSQHHLFNDSMALSLLGIGSLLGGLLHSKGV